MSPRVQLPSRYSHDLVRVGQGSFGVVFRSHDLLQDRVVAIKVPYRGEDEDLALEVTRELHAAARLRHPGIVEVLDAGVDPSGQPWLAMEFADAGSLDRYVRNPPSWQTLHPVLDQLLATLGHLHARGMVHRDLKVDNVLLARRACGRLVPKLADFGLAKVASRRGGFDATRIIAGTLAYMAPELFEGDVSAVHPATDLYAFGVLLYLLASGQLPWAQINQMSLMMAKATGEMRPFVQRPGSDAPPGLDRLIARLMAQHPAHRPALAADVRSALDALTAADRGAAPRPVEDRPAPRGRPAAAVATVREPLLVDRAVQRERLLWACDLAEGGQAVGVVLSGSPGAGRSRLAGWLLAELEESGRAEGLAVALDGEASPWAGVGDAIRNRLGLGRLEGEELRSKLEAWAVARGQPMEWLLRVLQDLLEPGHSGASAGLDARAVAASRAAAVDGFLRLSAQRGLAVAWIEERRPSAGAAELAAELLRAGQAAPTPRLVLFEPYADSAEAALPEGFVALSLDDLPDEDVVALLADLLPEGHAPAELAARVGRNAGKAVELARFLADRDRRTNQSLAQGTPVVQEEAELPEGDATVDAGELARRRLEAWLDEGERTPRARLLGLLALLPRPCPPVLLESAAGFGVIALLESAGYAGLVRTRDDGCVEFASGPLGREVAVELADADDRRDAAEALLASSSEPSPRRRLHAAGLLLDAGLAERALDLAGATAAGLVQRDAQAARGGWQIARRACTSLGLSREEPRSVEVALGEARAARAEGRLEATRAALSGLVVEQVPPELRAPLLELQTSVRLIGGELDQAVSLAREAGAAFGAAGDRAGCSRAFLLEAEALYRVGDVPAAIVAFDRAHREAATAGARREELGSLWRLARVRRSLGQHELARLELEEALDLARELRALSTEGAVLRELGNLDLAMGDGERAGEHFRQAIERLEAGGFRGDTATTRISLGELARARGDLEQAHAEYTVAHDTTMAYGITEDAVVALLDLAIVELAQSERQDVCERLREVDRLLPPGAASRLRPYIEALRLVVQASDRDWPGAVATLERLDGALMASAGDPDLLALVELAARRMAAAAPGALAVATIELARKMASGQGNHSRATLLDQQLATLRAE